MKSKIYDIAARILIFIPVFALFITSITVTETTLPVRYKLYDVNGDGKINMADVNYVFSIIATNSTEIPNQLLINADVNNDGVITSADALLIKLNIPTGFGSVTIQEAVPAVTPLVNNTFTSADVNGNIYDGSYNVINQQKMYIYPDLTQVMQMKDIFIIIAFGWGHGVGMSQWGALGLARAGYSYIQIIQHYYKDVSIMQETPPATVRCEGKNVDTEQMLARIVEKEIAGITNHNDPIDMNALRAQAVAAYTNMKYSGYSVSGCSYTGSYSYCREDVKAVAKEIVGQYMVYKDQVPYAYYSACSAGVAANYSDVWGETTRDMGYLYNSTSYYDCYTDGYISANAYSPQQIKDYILSYDSTIELSDNPADWIKILKHDDAVNENIGYVSSMQIGNKTLSQAAGIKFRDNIMHYNVKSPCFAIIYNGQYL